MNSVDRVKELCKNKRIPISRLEKDLGYSNGYISQLRKGVFPSNRLSEIAKYLDTSIEFLLNGDEIITDNIPVLADKDVKNVEKILDYTKQLLKQNDLKLDGKPINSDSLSAIFFAIQIGLEIAKKYQM